jgi:hypothetical protein
MQMLATADVTRYIWPVPLWPAKAEARTQHVQNRGFLDGVSPFSVHPPPSIPAFEDWNTLSLDAALRIPAFKRGVTLISGIIAQLPLAVYSNGVRVPPEDVYLDIAQPEAFVPWEVTAQQTVIDLIAYGRAYWMVTDVAKDEQGRSWPVRVEYVKASEVGDDGIKAPMVTVPDLGDVMKSSRRAIGTQLGDVIEFYAPAGNTLANGTQILNTALALESAAGNYAAAPMPALALKNEGADLPVDQVEGLLEAWEQARRERATAYLSASVTVEQYGFSARELQMVEGRNESAIQVARLLNLDPHYVGASLPGTSMTYSNRVDQRRDLIDFSCAPYMNTIEQRLTMRDVTPTKYSKVVQLNTEAFLRLNMQDRANLVAQLQPLGLLSDKEAYDLLLFNPSTTAGGISQG